MPKEIKIKLGGHGGSDECREKQVSAFITSGMLDWQAIELQNAENPHARGQNRTKREWIMRQNRMIHARQTVPPTVIFSMRSVGWPTPTGTLWPSLPHTPTPESSDMSLPIIVTYLSASGPLPISVAPLTG
ncbi:hypothetical protein AWB66_05281 [Caballeronia telluris]|uniref:Uncharacterized protein n=1 Tax=Caballeronia telluris TaxID=326475 RepID=A0A158K4H7_9BURK|nr:hypothetical protein AWB66_05281 [Caballeronia telluris]